MEELEVCPWKVITAKNSPSCSSKKTKEVQLQQHISLTYNVIYMEQNPTAK